MVKGSMPLYTNLFKLTQQEMRRCVTTSSFFFMFNHYKIRYEKILQNQTVRQQLGDLSVLIRRLDNELNKQT